MLFDLKKFIDTVAALINIYNKSLYDSGSLNIMMELARQYYIKIHHHRYVYLKEYMEQIPTLQNTKIEITVFTQMVQLIINSMANYPDETAENIAMDLAQYNSFTKKITNKNIVSFSSDEDLHVDQTITKPENVNISSNDQNDNDVPFHIFDIKRSNSHIKNSNVDFNASSNKKIRANSLPSRSNAPSIVATDGFNSNHSSRSNSLPSNSFQTKQALQKSLLFIHHPNSIPKLEKSTPSPQQPPAPLRPPPPPPSTKTTSAQYQLSQSLSQKLQISANSIIKKNVNSKIKYETIENNRNKGPRRPLSVDLNAIRKYNIYHENNDKYGSILEDYAEKKLEDSFSDVDKYVIPDHIPQIKKFGSPQNHNNNDWLHDNNRNNNDNENNNDENENNNNDWWNEILDDAITTELFKEKQTPPKSSKRRKKRKGEFLNSQDHHLLSSWPDFVFYYILHVFALYFLY